MTKSSHNESDIIYNHILVRIEFFRTTAVCVINRTRVYDVAERSYVCQFTSFKIWGILNILPQSRGIQRPGGRILPVPSPNIITHMIALVVRRIYLNGVPPRTVLSQMNLLRIAWNEMPSMFKINKKFIVLENFIIFLPHLPLRPPKTTTVSTVTSAAPAPIKLACDTTVYMTIMMNTCKTCPTT